MNTSRYRDLNTALREHFGCRVQKITLDAGMTCPNRDGTLGVGGCIYCSVRGSGTGLSQHYSISEQLERGKSRLARRYKAKKFIAYFQSFSNTYGSPQDLQALYQEALAVEDVVGLAIGTRPDCASGRHPPIGRWPRPSASMYPYCSRPCSCLEPGWEPWAAVWQCLTSAC